MLKVQGTLQVQGTLLVWADSVVELFKQIQQTNEHNDLYNARGVFNKFVSF